MIPDFLFVVFMVIQWIIMIYMAFGTLYIFLFATASLFPHRPETAEPGKFHRIAVLIPGYKEDAVILEVAKDAIRQTYPRDQYEVVIIADSFQPETLSSLRELPVRIQEVSFEQSTKSKALNTTMSLLPDGVFEIAVILDADNMMEDDFLVRINEACNRGFIAIQGHRIAKNTNSSFAVLDAVSEEVNNSVFRKGHRRLGLSSSLIGSGMAFHYDFFKNLMSTVQAVGGFDKEIELKMLKQGVKIEYLDQAYVYDEKVQKEEVFVKQRRRWLSAQIHYASYFGDALRMLALKGNTDYFDKALQMLLPPRILLIGLLPVFTLLSIVVNPLVYTLLWAGLFLLLVLTFLFAIPRKLYNFQTLAALLSIPRGIILMMVSLLSTKGANKKFIHTEHTSTRTNQNKDNEDRH